MWTCPKCQRQFKNANQWHGCRQIKLTDLLHKRSKRINDLYALLHSQFSFNNFRREVIPPDVIVYKSKSTFLVVKLKTKWIDIEFFLDYYLDQPTVKKWLRTSKRRYAYIISIDEHNDITSELLNWINYSYNLLNK